MAEIMFEVELHVYRNEDKTLGDIIRSSTPCTVESDVKQHIDFIGKLTSLQFYTCVVQFPFLIYRI